MNAILEAALEIQAFCTAQGWRFCFIGGIAVQHWGEPRLTRDVDVTVLTGFGGEAEFVDRVLTAFSPRRADAREFAIRNRVLLISSASGVPLDLSLGAMPFEEHAVARARPVRISPGTELLICTAEDLIVFKAFAGRDTDWADIRSIVARRGGALDRPLIFGELEPLLELKEAPENGDRLRAMLDAVGR
ncbi:MAG: hypothetical protein U0821_23015 [Chloroflexota bacterium]